VSWVLSWDGRSCLCTCVCLLLALLRHSCYLGSDWEIKVPFYVEVVISKKYCEYCNLLIWVELHPLLWSKPLQFMIPSLKFIKWRECYFSCLQRCHSNVSCLCSFTLEVTPWVTMCNRLAQKKEKNNFLAWNFLPLWSEIGELSLQEIVSDSEVRRADITSKNSRNTESLTFESKQISSILESINVTWQSENALFIYFSRCKFIHVWY